MFNPSLEQWPVGGLGRRLGWYIVQQRNQTKHATPMLLCINMDTLIPTCITIDATLTPIGIFESEYLLQGKEELI